jgi:hypothetical protein
MEKETEKRIEKKTKKKKKRRINGLVCVAGRYPERTSNFDTLHACTHQAHSLLWRRVFVEAN